MANAVADSSRRTSTDGSSQGRGHLLPLHVWPPTSPRSLGGCGSRLALRSRDLIAFMMVINEWANWRSGFFNRLDGQGSRFGLGIGAETGLSSLVASRTADGCRPTIEPGPVPRELDGDARRETTR